MLTCEVEAQAVNFTGTAWWGSGFPYISGLEFSFSLLFYVSVTQLLVPSGFYPVPHLRSSTPLRLSQDISSSLAMFLGVVWLKICCVLRGESHTTVCSSVVTQEIQLKLLSFPKTVSLASRPWSPSVFTTLSFTPIAFSSAPPPLHSFLDRTAFFLPVKSCFHSHRQTLRCLLSWSRLPSVLKHPPSRLSVPIKAFFCWHFLQLVHFCMWSH